MKSKENYNYCKNKRGKIFQLIYEKTYNWVLLKKSIHFYRYLNKERMWIVVINVMEV